MKTDFRMGIWLENQENEQTNNKNAPCFYYCGISKTVSITTCPVDYASGGYAICVKEPIPEENNSFSDYMNGKKLKYSDLFKY